MSNLKSNFSQKPFTRWHHGVFNDIWTSDSCSFNSYTLNLYSLYPLQFQLKAISTHTISTHYSLNPMQYNNILMMFCETFFRLTATLASNNNSSLEVNQQNQIGCNSIIQVSLYFCQFERNDIGEALHADTGC